MFTPENVLEKITSEYIKNNIGKYIKNKRKEAGLSQKALGEKLNVSQQMIAQYETGKRKPKLDTLISIANALDIDIPTDPEQDNIGFIFSALQFSQENHKDKRLSFAFEKLNDTGKEKAIEQVELLTKIPEYKKDPENQDQE